MGDGVDTPQTVTTTRAPTVLKSETQSPSLDWPQPVGNRVQLGFNSGRQTRVWSENRKVQKAFQKGKSLIPGSNRKTNMQGVLY